MNENMRIIESIDDKRIENAVNIINSCDISEVKKVELIFLFNVLKNMNNQRRSTGKKDILGQEVLEGDLIENQYGVCMKICYGTYEAFCPDDGCYMDNVGFYAVGENLPDMPIGNLEDYAIKIGNVYDNPDLEAILNE